MTKKIIIGIVAVAVVLGLGYMFSSKKSAQDIYVFVESGKVSTKENKEGSYMELTEKKKVLKTGAFVRTEAGLAHVLFPDNSSLSLGENSEIEVTYSKKSTSINQLAGETYHRVNKLLTGNTYSVYTAGTLAAVRGTKFAVRYDIKTKKAKVAVTENTVAVSRLTASSTEMDVSVGIQATVDETISITNGKQLVTLSPTKNDVTVKVWLERNALLDEYISKDGRAILENLIKTEATGKDLNALRLRLEKSRANTTTEVKASTDTKKTSLKRLLTLGGSQKCSYSYNANGVISNATVYLDKGKMRADSSVTTGGRTMEYHMILMNETSYVWGDGMPQGMKMSVSNLNTATPENMQAESFDMSKELDYSCSNWSSDSKIFTLPTGITFMDLSQMMKQVSPTVEVQTRAVIDTANQCTSCDTLPEPTRTQCRTALSCR